MTITTVSVAYAACLLTFLAVDAVWLGKVAKNYYEEQLGNLKRETPNWIAAAIFYLCYVAGIVWLAVLPALSQGDWVVAARTGALIGFLAYGTYDMTNLATLKGWPKALSFVDWTWGTVLSGVSALLAYLAATL